MRVPPTLLAVARQCTVQHLAHPGGVGRVAGAAQRPRYHRPSSRAEGWVTSTLCPQHASGVCFFILLFFSLHPVFLLREHKTN